MKVSELIDAELCVQSAKVTHLINLSMRIFNKKMEDEESPKECPKCKTKNYHYYPDKDVWCCANC